MLHKLEFGIHRSHQEISLNHDIFLEHVGLSSGLAFETETLRCKTEQEERWEGIGFCVCPPNILQQFVSCDKCYDSFLSHTLF